MSKTAMDVVVQLDTETKDDHHHHHRRQQQQQQQQQPENGFVSPEATGTTTTPPPPGLLTRIDHCVLPFLGGFGRYQRQLIVLTWIPALFIGFSQYSDNFLLAQPNSTCVLQPPVPANATNLTKSHSALFHNGPHNGSSNGSSSAARSSFMYANGTYRGTRNATAANTQQCDCKEWTFELQTGLVRNVVTKVSGVVPP